MSLLRTPLFILLTPSALACASGGTTITSPPRTVRPPASTTASAPTATASWSPRYIPGTFQYEIRTEATIRLDTDTARQERPVEQTLLYTVQLAPQGQLLRITGVVDSLATQAQQTVPSPDSVAFRNPWHGLVTALGRVSPIQPDTGVCRPDKQIPLQPIHEILISHPEKLTAGDQWKDTTTTLTCRGDVAVSTTSINSYRIDGPENHHGTPALRVTRSSEVSIRGSGRESGRSVSLAGGGGGTTTIYLDQTNGMVINSSGETRSVITIRTLTGEIPFRQQVRQEVTRRM